MGKWLYSAVTLFVLLTVVLIYEYRRKKAQGRKQLFVTYHDMKQMERENEDLKTQLESETQKRQEAERRSQELKEEVDLYQRDGTEITVLSLRADMTELAYKPGKVEKRVWEKLEEDINILFPHLTVRIREVYPKISHPDLHMIYLSLLEVRPADIARLLEISDTNIGRTKKRIYKNLTGEDMTGDFADFVEKI